MNQSQQFVKPATEHAFNPKFDKGQYASFVQDEKAHTSSDAFSVATQITLESLPVEILELILSFSPTAQSLQNLCLSTPILHRVYVANREILLLQVLRRDLESRFGLLVHADFCNRINNVTLLHNCSVERRPAPAGPVTARTSARLLWNEYHRRMDRVLLLERICEKETVGTYLHVTESGVIQLPYGFPLIDMFHQKRIIDTYVRDCHAYLLFNAISMLQIPNDSHDHALLALSPIEEHRLYRSFYRFDAFCRTAFSGCFTKSELQDQFLYQFRPWEVEEMMVVYNYLRWTWHGMFAKCLTGEKARMENVFPDLANSHDKKVTFPPLMGDLELYIDGNIMHGLGYLWNVQRMTSVERRTRLLSHWPIHGPHCWFTALSSTNRYREQPWTHRASTEHADIRFDGDLSNDDEDENDDSDYYEGHYPDHDNDDDYIEEEEEDRHEDRSKSAPESVNKPNAAWLWQMESENLHTNIKHQGFLPHAWGWVIWDKQRLDSWKILEQDAMSFRKPQT